jgi:hypothetical protein
MSQWFRGQLEGHYVGTSSGKPGVSQYGSASRYKLRIYRALVRDIEVLEPGETIDELESEDAEDSTETKPPIDLPDDCFYQAQIEDARLLGIRPRSCFEGTIYDVAVSQLRVTHSTKKGDKTYGRLEGEVYGRFLLPPESDAEEVAQVVEELTATEEPVATGSEKPLKDASEAPEARMTPGPGHDTAGPEIDPSGREIEPLHPPEPPGENVHEDPARVPIPLLVIVMAIVLWLGAGAEPALLFIGVCVPIVIIRLILGGLFKVTRSQKVFGAVLVLIQFLCLGLLMLDWWSAGCKLINPYAVSGIGVTALIASVLPSPLPLVCAGGSLGLVLFLWYGDVGAKCEEYKPEPPPVEEAAERPTVDDPGVPRTNDDGSWPRRGPRPTPRP